MIELFVGLLWERSYMTCQDTSTENENKLHNLEAARRRFRWPSSRLTKKSSKNSARSAHCTFNRLLNKATVSHGSNTMSHTECVLPWWCVSKSRSVWPQLLKTGEGQAKLETHEHTANNNWIQFLMYTYFTLSLADTHGSYYYRHIRKDWANKYIRTINTHKNKFKKNGKRKQQIKRSKRRKEERGKMKKIKRKRGRIQGGKDAWRMKTHSE